MEAKPLVEVGTGGLFWILMTASQVHWVATISQSNNPPSVNLSGPCVPPIFTTQENQTHFNAEEAHLVLSKLHFEPCT